MADVELLPLPEWTKRDDLGGFVPSQVRAGMRDYARANLATLQAENARLRAEVTALQREVGQLHMREKRAEAYAVEKVSETLKAVMARRDAESRAERLAEALRDAEKSLRTIADLAGGTEYLMTIGDVRGYANSRANAARAALAQEDRND